ncbi:winged helix-turn-helix transcriptional regulator, partial [Staphylococcus aureus]
VIVFCILRDQNLNSPKVEYKLTSIGYKLDKVVYAICEWGDLFKDEIIH